MSAKIACHHCKKAYVNVLEHITKSHSYLQIYTYEDGEIADSDDCPDGGEYKLFWKDQLFNQTTDFHPINGHYWAITMTNTGFDGVVTLTIARAPGATTWRVYTLQTETWPVADHYGAKTTIKHYTAGHIQILQKRVSRRPSTTNPDSDRSPLQETEGSTLAGSPA